MPGEHHVESLPEGFTPQEGGPDLDCEDVFKEVAILRRLDSPHALRLREYFISPGGTVLYIVTDLLEGGQLLHALLQQGEEAYGETDARAAFAGVRAFVCFSFFCLGALTPSRLHVSAAARPVVPARARSDTQGCEGAWRVRFQTRLCRARRG